MTILKKLKRIQFLTKQCRNSGLDHRNGFFKGKSQRYRKVYMFFSELTHPARIIKRASL